MSDIERVIGALYPAVTIDGRRATAVFEPQPEHRGNPGWLQGGWPPRCLIMCVPGPRLPPSAIGW